MEEYKQALLEKIQELLKSDSPFAKSGVRILLKLLGELQK